MSIVSSYFSSRSTALGINPQFASIMESICAIGCGLGVRFVIGAVSHNDLKVTGTLVGLWEGVVMQHFLRKMPSSADPYVAYGVRLFIDFLFTESLARLVLVLVWTGMGVVFADIVPALWIDAGLRRIWRRFRRDLYVMFRSIPSVPYPRTRTVRFSPSQTASVISSIPPSIFTTNTQDPVRLDEPTPVLRKRPVPGAFPGDVSETETDIGSVLGLRHGPSELSTAPGTMNHRFSSFMRRDYDDTESDISSDMNDLDDGNLSSAASSTTEMPDPSAMNPSEIPDYDEEEMMMDGKKSEESDRELTPKQSSLPLPTPPDSFALRDHDEPDGLQPPPEVPAMPDEDWEEISRGEAMPTPTLKSKDLPPPLPPKDDPPTGASASPLPVPPIADKQSTTTVHDSTGRLNDTLIDFSTNETPTSSKPQDQPADLLLQRGTTPPPSVFSTGDIFNIDRSRPPPPYGQDEANWNDSGSTLTPLKPISGDQTSINKSTGNSNDDPSHNPNPNQNDLGDITKDGTTAAGVDAPQQQETEQAQTDAPQTHSGVLDKGKAKDSNDNGSNAGNKRQKTKSRSGGNTPRAGSKPGSGDEGPDAGAQQGNTSTAWGKRASFTSVSAEANANGSKAGAKRQSGSVAGDADKNMLEPGPEGQPATSGLITTPIMPWASAGDQTKSDNKTTNTDGNNTDGPVGSTQNNPPTASDSTKRRSVTFNTGTADNKDRLSGSVGDKGAGTAPHEENSGGDKANNTNNNGHNPTAEGSQPGPSIIAKSSPTLHSSPVSSEKSDLPTTSGDLLKQALELRKQIVSLDEKIPNLEQQYNGAVGGGLHEEVSARKTELDAAVREKEQLSGKVARRLAGACSQ
jgi:hypothetical protein